MDTQTTELIVKGIVRATSLFAAGLCMGLGSVGCGLSEGFAAAKACEAVGKAPENTNVITRTMLIGQAVAESNAIYSLVIALLLFFSSN